MQIKLNNVKYDIKMTDKTDKDLGDATRGIVYYEDLRILLDKNLPEDLIIQTMYHEISHAICAQTSFNDMLVDKLGENGYEIFIDNMGKLLYDIIHNNDMKTLERKALKKDVDKTNKDNETNTR